MCVCAAAYISVPICVIERLSHKKANVALLIKLRSDNGEQL